MATLYHNPKTDEYARLRAENEAEISRLERDAALRRKQSRATDDRQALDVQSLHFQRHFAAMTGRGATAAKPAARAPEGSHARAADYYGYYYGQL